MLTERQIRGAKPRDTEYRIGDGRGGVAGLFLRIYPTGRKSWQVQHATKGKVLARKKLGEWPTLSLHHARDLALDWLEEQRAKRLAPSAKREVKFGTAHQLLEGYINDMKARGRKSADEVQKQLKRHVYDELEGMLAKDVREEHITAVLRRVYLDGHRVQANRLRSYVQSAWRWGRRRDRDYRLAAGDVRFGIEVNPAADIPRDASAERVADRVLTWHELGMLWGACDDVISHQMQIALLLCVATGGQRPLEVLGATAAEFDAPRRVWKLPGSRTKNRRPHLVPLTDMAWGLVQYALAWRPEKDTDYLFPKAGGKEPREVAVLWKATARMVERVGTEIWNPRDLRTTCKTLGAEVGLSKEIRDRIQNHALSDVSSKHYDMWEYEAEKREALEAWCSALSARSGWRVLKTGD